MVRDREEDMRRGEGGGGVGGVGWGGWGPLLLPALLLSLTGKARKCL